MTNLIENITMNRFENFGKNSREYHPVMLIVGAEGLGKTRGNQAVSEIISNSKYPELVNMCRNQINLFVTYNDGTKMNTRDMEIGPEASFASRMLLQYFGLNRSLLDKISYLNGFQKHMTIDKALDIILYHHHYIANVDSIDHSNPSKLHPEGHS